jgi:hypothetical protein
LLEAAIFGDVKSVGDKGSQRRDIAKAKEIAERG